MPGIISDEIYVKSIDEVRMFSIDFTDKLNSGELLTGSPTVEELTTSDLTIANVAVSTAQLTIKDRTVVIGAAVQFTVTGGTAGSQYQIRIITSTDATPAQTFYWIVKMNVVANTG